MPPFKTKRKSKWHGELFWIIQLIWLEMFIVASISRVAASVGCLLGKNKASLCFSQLSYDFLGLF
jgi:hypothetical protein